jgi:hypothetical protein
VPVTPVTPEAYDTCLALLTGLRDRDPRLLMPEKAIQDLIPAAADWLQRGIPAPMMRRCLLHDLPSGTIHHPAGLIGHRLIKLIPPPSTSTPHPRLTRVPGPPIHPFQNCDTCERVFRAPTPGGLCSHCTRHAAV